MAMALLPAAAMAHHERHHHHHQRSHHHARSRTKRFGERGSSPGGPPQQNHPATPPAPAGTIQSFDGTTLTIMLANGSLVSGQVANRTEIECRMAGDRDGNGDNEMRSDDGGPGPSGSGGQGNGGPGNDGNGGSGNDGSGNDGNGGPGNDGNGNDNGRDDEMCSTTALTAGAVVQDATLSISSAGAVWTRVDLAS
jgi:hypothetical protein